jgi:hypothetical protein
MTSQKLIIACVLVGVIAVAAAAQKGTAESGYYPASFPQNLNTWTGDVTTVDEQTREVTLTYTHGNKTQTFVGYIQDSGVESGRDDLGDDVIDIVPVKKDSPGKAKEPQPRHLNLQDLVGRTIKVYYFERERKIDQTKVKVNVVVRIKVISKK